MKIDHRVWVVSVTAAVAITAQAETIGFSCKRTGVNNPRTYYYVLDLTKSTVTLTQSVDMGAYTAPANISPSSVDWSASPSAKGKLDRQSGIMTLTMAGGYEMTFTCQRTSGI